MNRALLTLLVSLWKLILFLPRPLHKVFILILGNLICLMPIKRNRISKKNIKKPSPTNCQNANPAPSQCFTKRRNIGCAPHTKNDKNTKINPIDGCVGANAIVEYDIYNIYYESYILSKKCLHTRFPLT